MGEKEEEKEDEEDVEEEGPDEKRERCSMSRKWRSRRTAGGKAKRRGRGGRSKGDRGTSWCPGGVATDKKNKKLGQPPSVRGKS